MPPSSSFGHDYTNNGVEDLGRDVIVSKLAGEAVVKVIKRCEEAKENKNKLDLSDCQLTQIPDAVFYLMRDVELRSCDLSVNVIRKLPAKFSVEFSLLTDLNLSNNEIYKLPDEFVQLKVLVRLDISNNYLLNLPSVLFKLPKLRQLRAHHNAIIDIQSNEIIASDSLELVDLRSNPLTQECYDLLTNANVSFHIDLSPRRIRGRFDHLKNIKIICIGAPRLHEYLKFNFSQLQIRSIILDLDSRLKLFFDSHEYFEYNMLNDHFFEGPETRSLFEEFLKETTTSKTCVVTDPPFACRTEPIAFTIKTIGQRYRKLNSILHVLPVMWIFPYFMENYIKNVMPEMDMLDYMVNYTNHKLYHDGKNGRKGGSPIRIFTNIPLNLIPISVSEGYRYCKLCVKYTFMENSHCKKCRKCPSKNGSKYVHCELCAICVKPSYRHCMDCGRCTQIANHNCENYQRNITCWICMTKGHNEMRCEKWATYNQQNFNIKKKSIKLRKRICLICNKAGHNEQKCNKRNILLKERKFLGEIFNIFSN